jgi:hypothetical protein
MAKQSKGGFIREFISEENRNYRVQIGSTIASSLAGMVCGVVITSIIWFIALNYIVTVINNIYMGQSI